MPWVQPESFLPVTKSSGEQLSDEESLRPFLDVLPDAQFYLSTNANWAAVDGAFKSLFGQLHKQPASDVLS